MIQILNKITNKLLNRNICFDKNIPIGYFISFCATRFIMLMRGVFCIGLKRKGKNLFIGKKVQIQCRKMLQVGNCVSLQDEVLINALSCENVILEDNVSIGRRTMIKASGSLTSIGKGFFIGHDSAMGNDCFVGAAGGVRIGEYVAIGQNVRFHSENHDFARIDIKICEQGVTNKGIEVGNDCWIGAGVVFLDGVHVGNGCVIGANSVVTKDIPSMAVAVGAPAKVITVRKSTIAEG